MFRAGLESGQPHGSGGLDFTMGNYLGKHSRSLRRHERRPSLTRTPPRQSWGRGPSPLGVAANTGPSVDVSFTASCAAPTGRVPGLRGASSSPVHRALVLVLGTNIAVLLDCSKSSRQCSLPYLLTYYQYHARTPVPFSQRYSMRRSRGARARSFSFCSVSNVQRGARCAVAGAWAQPRAGARGHAWPGPVYTLF